MKKGSIKFLRWITGDSKNCLEKNNRQIKSV